MRLSAEPPAGSVRLQLTQTACLPRTAAPHPPWRFPLPTPTAGFAPRGKPPPARQFPTHLACGRLPSPQIRMRRSVGSRLLAGRPLSPVFFFALRFGRSTPAGPSAPFAPRTPHPSSPTTRTPPPATSAPRPPPARTRSRPSGSIGFPRPAVGVPEPSAQDTPFAGLSSAPIPQRFALGTSLASPPPSGSPNPLRGCRLAARSSRQPAQATARARASPRHALCTLAVCYFFAP
jgi:hypothetical protein